MVFWCILWNMDNIALTQPKVRSLGAIVVSISGTAWNVPFSLQHLFQIWQIAKTVPLRTSDILPSLPVIIITICLWSLIAPTTNLRDSRLNYFLSFSSLFFTTLFTLTIKSSSTSLSNPEIHPLLMNINDIFMNTLLVHYALWRTLHMVSGLLHLVRWNMSLLNC